jgi:dTMP kinase
MNTNKQRGLFISLEGPDGAGKTTQVSFIVEHLRNLGFDVIQTREPGGNPFAEKIRDILLCGVMCNKAELLLFAAARADHVENTIKPALAEGKIVICDRFSDSTYAYQGSARNMKNDVEELERFVLRGFEPDHTLYFDLTLEESMKRLFGRMTDINVFDAQTRNFKKDVYNGYKKRFLMNPHRMHKIDAMKPIEHVTQQVKEWIDKVLVLDMYVSSVEKEQLM